MAESKQGSAQPEHRTRTMSQLKDKSKKIMQHHAYMKGTDAAKGEGPVRKRIASVSSHGSRLSKGKLNEYQPLGNTRTMHKDSQS